MNRVIKFRAWDKHKREMIMPDTERDIAIDLDGYLFEDDFNGSVPLINHELMQFTGLHDKNGKEIYADDLLSDGKNTFRVYSMDGGFVTKNTFWGNNHYDLKLGDDLICMPLTDAQNYSYITKSCEVIGNIYETKQNEK